MPDIQENMTQAARDVLAERERQITVKSWTPESDDNYTSPQLAKAAASYALNAAGFQAGVCQFIWPWGEESWRPSTPRRDLIKAAALLIAEIERLDRADRGES